MAARALSTTQAVRRAARALGQSAPPRHADSPYRAVAGNIIIPVILSGGAGTRLWPLSRQARPKQFHALGGARSLLQDTALRVACEGVFAAPIVVGGAAHAPLIEAQLSEVGVAPATLILEPVGRNTALAIALAALEAGGGDALLLVVPSDHIVADRSAFHAAIGAGAAAARGGALVTFGVRPDRAETGYGYIGRGAMLSPGVHRVERFVEKPDRATAQGFVAGGRHDWNAGIFLFRADRLLAELEAHAPDISYAARAAFEGASRDGPRLRPQAAAFAAGRAQSIDHAVMEHARDVAVVPVAMGWSDVGGWDQLYELGDQDGDGNVTVGEVSAAGSRNCLIRSQGPLVVASGVENLIVIATADAVLILPRGEGQRVREAVEALGEGRAHLR